MAKILKKGNLSDFIIYLNEQIGQPYLWGGQHTKLTPENYVSVITKREKVEKNRDAAIAYCKTKFDEGATVLYAYDCSGLGCYYLCDKEHIISSDTTANGLMNLCEVADEPMTGYWLFRLNDEGRATHIGYLVSDDMVVHAKGRAYGVVREHIRPNGREYWHRVAKPLCFDFDNPEPPDPPEPPTPPEPKRYVEVIAKSVRVRASDSVLGRTQFIAHKGDMFPYIGVAPSGWYQIETGRDKSYITSKIKYTKLVDE